MEPAGLIGILMVFAGLHLLWRARREMVYWLDRFLAIFLRAFRQAASPNASAAVRDAPPDADFLSKERQRGGLLLILGGAGLVLLGQLLFILDLIF